MKMKTPRVGPPQCELDQRFICGVFEGGLWDQQSAPAHHTRSKTKQGGANMMPLIQLPGGQTVYKPWAHRDLQTLVEALPLPEESGCRWVKAFESLTAADELTVGDC